MGQGSHSNNRAHLYRTQVRRSLSVQAEQLEGTRRVPVAGFPKHRVFYQIEPKGIFVLRVVHGARDLESLFSI